MTLSVSLKGNSELAARFDEFPQGLRDRLAARIGELTEDLEGAAQAAAPVKTGLLRSEITPKVYADSETRVAGYVSIFASGNTKEYPKAATLEYGSDKPRRRFERQSVLMNRLHGAHRKIIGRTAGNVHIRAFRYLRDPFDAMQDAADAAISQEVEQYTAEQS